MPPLLGQLLVRAVYDVGANGLDLVLAQLPRKGNHSVRLPHAVVHDALPCSRARPGMRSNRHAHRFQLGVQVQNSAAVLAPES